MWSPENSSGVMRAELMSPKQRQLAALPNLAGPVEFMKVATASGGEATWRRLLTLRAFAAFVLATIVSARADDLTDWRTKMQPIIPLSYVVHHTAKPIAIDGKLDDAVWAGAPWTSDFVDIEGDTKARPRFRTRAKLLWDDTYLYIAAELEEPHVWGTLTKHDSVIFRDSDFEVFIDPDGDTHAYSEFEINALNTGWDLLLPKPYQDGGPPQDSWEIPGLKTAVHIDGTLNEPSDTDRGWTVEIAFPWKAFEAHARHSGPPHEGEQWRLNFSRVEWMITANQGAYQKVPDTPEDNWVWSPQGVIDMHRPEMWGVLQFTRKSMTLVTPVPGKAARDRVLEVYYAERGYFAEHQRWAATLEELGLVDDRLGLAPLLDFTTEGYACRVPFADKFGRHREWCIRQDRKLTLQDSSSDSKK